MKTLMLLAVLTAPILAEEAAAKAAPVIDLDWKGPQSVTIEVKPLLAGKITQNNFKTDYGSYDKDQVRMRKIQVSIRNYSKEPRKLTVETLWFVTPEKPPKDRIAPQEPFIGSREVTIDGEMKPSQTASGESSSLAESNRTRYEALNESYADGIKFVGWVVVAREGNKVVGAKAGTPTLEKLLKGSPAPLNAVLKDYEEAMAKIAE